ncbi:tetratricopeptide repeat protein [Treponema sp. HNW]|uniref:tetratricopeptide repeat protein n=1 Tax=Treponema sp. HNW TaxID=3116654 RepID=UPI003D136884
MAKFFASLLLISALVSCKSLPKQNDDTNPAVDAVPIEARELPAVKTQFPPDIFSPYFKGIPSDILFLIQNGSPSSIAEAVSRLQKTGAYSEQSGVLLALCASVFKYAWPNERISWNVPGDLPDNLYTATLRSIDNGIPAFSSVDDDVFMLTIPCLAVLSPSASHGVYEQSAGFLKKALKMYPRSVLALYLAGITGLRTKDYQSALEYLKAALEAEPINPYAGSAYAQALSETGSIEEAYTLLQRFLASDPMNPALLKLNAKTALMSGRYKEAESLAGRILQREPDNREFLLFRARVLFELKEYLSAATLLDLYARTDKTAKEYLLLRARLQAEWNKNINAALGSVQEALNGYSDDTDVLLLAAELASLSGQSINSLTAFDFASLVLEKNPKNVRALAVFAKDAVKKKDWQRAYDAVSSLAGLQSLSLEHTLLSVQICLALKKNQEARSLLEQVYSPDTSDEHILQWYIRLLISEGKKNEAASLIDSFLPKSSGKMKSILYYERSRLALNDSQVLADLRSSLTSNPRNEEALYDLYLYYYRQKDYRKAQYYLKQVIALNPADPEFLKLNADLDTKLK